MTLISTPELAEIIVSNMDKVHYSSSWEDIEKLQPANATWISFALYGHDSVDERGLFFSYDDEIEMGRVLSEVTSSMFQAEILNAFRKGQVYKFKISIGPEGEFQQFNEELGIDDNSMLLQ